MAWPVRLTPEHLRFQHNRNEIMGGGWGVESSVLGNHGQCSTVVKSIIFGVRKANQEAITELYELSNQNRW